MEWTGGQQIGLLMESGGLGLFLGFLFDVSSGLSRATPGRRVARFILDALFGLVAALITFFVSLAIMDGQMHPLLFFGSGLGFAVEHIGAGRWVSRFACFIRCTWRRGTRTLLTTAEGMLVGVYTRISGFCCRERAPKVARKDQKGKTGKKNTKKPTFFQKSLEI